jgi:hypothetical protein
MNNMNKKSIGVGSASIVLVFAVLCLTIFAVISYAASTSNSALVDVEKNMIQSYYQADVTAEKIFSELLNTGDVPESILGVELESGWDWDLEAEIVSFTVEISEMRELYVAIAFHEDHTDIVEWRMRNTGNWETDDGFLDLFVDDSLSLWPGD